MSDAPSVNEHVYFIAEAGVNHNGSLDLAFDLVEVAARANADAVKFQTFKAERLVTARARLAKYQAHGSVEERGQLDMLRKLEFSQEAYRLLAARCQELGIAFMSTAFDVDSLALLDRLKMPAIKIASGDLTAAPLVLAAASLKRPLILSTGMCALTEIEEALGVIAFGLIGEQQVPSRRGFKAAYESAAGQAELAEKVTLLHCVTEYPAPISEINLRAMDSLRSKFGLRVGYSDHTTSLSVPVAAVARGAAVLEKHFTLDRSLAGPDHRASLEPDELVRLVREVREVEAALGTDRKQPTPSELVNRSVVRRSLVAAKAITRGEPYTISNLAVKRPGGGLAPIGYWEILGCLAERDYLADDPIEAPDNLHPTGNEIVRKNG